MVAAVLAAAPLSEPAFLAHVDRILATDDAHRVASAEPVLCPPVERRLEPGAEHRAFLCDATASAGTFTLDGVHATGGKRYAVELEVRRFVSPEAARAAKQLALQRYGGPDAASVDSGGLAWCQLDLGWTDELLFVLRYGCHITPAHVRAVAEVRRLIYASATPFGEAQVAGVWSPSGGFSQTAASDGQPRPVSDRLRFTRFVQLVKPDAPQELLQHPAGRLQADVLAAGARCVPLVFEPESAEVGWLRVKASRGEGWVPKAAVKEQSVAECIKSRAGQ